MMIKFAHRSADFPEALRNFRIGSSADCAVVSNGYVEQRQDFGMPFLTYFPYAAQKSERAARVVIKKCEALAMATRNRTVRRTD
jgi:hypothetical protein